MQVTIEDVQVNSGERAKFQAVIEGTPPPTVLWFKVRADVSLAENKDHRKDYKTTFLWGNPFCTVILHLLHRILSVDVFFFTFAAVLPGTTTLEFCLVMVPVPLWLLSHDHSGDISRQEGRFPRV